MNLAALVMHFTWLSSVHAALPHHAGSQSFDLAELPPDRIALYKNGEWDYLDNLVRPEDAGKWLLSNAHGIDERGRILGAGSTGAFIASPVPEPVNAALLLGGMGIVVIGARRRRSTAAANISGQ
jgi:hypothetical protein